MSKLLTIDLLIESFRKLPGVGSKSAERMAYQVLEMKEESVKNFIISLEEVINKISKCPICGSYSEEGICPFCDDESRSSSQLIIVSSYKDALAIDKLNKNYRFHILNGSISPSKGIGIKDINLPSLFERINEEEINEIILATNPTIDGETTALYISKLLEEYPQIKVSRLAYGLPMGGQLDYADELTLSKAIEGRQTMRKEK